MSNPNIGEMNRMNLYTQAKYYDALYTLLETKNFSLVKKIEDRNATFSKYFNLTRQVDSY